MDVPAELESLLKHKGITQSELAERAGVSQPTVSRARRRVPGRNSRSYRQLCSYIRKELNEISLPNPACDAVVEIWDGSPEHAEALATLIRAAGNLSRAANPEDSP